jgi:hypothetical protein
MRQMKQKKLAWWNNIKSCGFIWHLNQTMSFSFYWGKHWVNPFSTWPPDSGAKSDWRPYSLLLRIARLLVVRLTIANRESSEFFFFKMPLACSLSEQLHQWNQRGCKGHRLLSIGIPASPEPNSWKLTELVFHHSSRLPPKQWPPWPVQDTTDREVIPLPLYFIFFLFPLHNCKHGTCYPAEELCNDAMLSEAWQFVSLPLHCTYCHSVSQALWMVHSNRRVFLRFSLKGNQMEKQIWGHQSRGANDHRTKCFRANRISCLKRGIHSYPELVSGKACDVVATRLR